MKTAIFLFVLLVSSPNIANANERLEDLAALHELQGTANLLVSMWRSGTGTGQLATIMLFSGYMTGLMSGTLRTLKYQRQQRNLDFKLTGIDELRVIVCAPKVGASEAVAANVIGLIERDPKLMRMEMLQAVDQAFSQLYCKW